MPQKPAKKSPPPVQPPALPPCAEGFRRHPPATFALSGFLGVLIDCVPNRTPDGAVRDVLAFIVRKGTPETTTVTPQGTAWGEAAPGALVFVDAPELLALGAACRTPQAVGLDPSQALLVRLHRVGAAWVGDVARDPVPRG